MSTFSKHLCICWRRQGEGVGRAKILLEMGLDTIYDLRKRIKTCLVAAIRFSTVCLMVLFMGVEYGLCAESEQVLPRLTTELTSAALALHDAMYLRLVASTSRLTNAPLHFPTTTAFNMLYRLPFLTLLLTSQTFASPLSPTKPGPFPLLIWHGLGDNYAADGLHSVGDLANSTVPGTFVYYIRLDEDAGSDRTATFLGNLTEQIAKVCADITSHPVLSSAPAVNALGFSQGGQFLRGMIERCGGDIKVKNLVTFGSQHNGIAKYQLCKDGDWVCKGYIGLLKANTWGSWVQGHLVPAQYFKSTDEETGQPTEEYLENSNFLADVNNERKLKNVAYKENLSKLDNFVMYVFEDDTTVIPKESGWFAYTNSTDGKVTQLRDRQIYKEDWIGLKALDKKGGLHFKTTKGGHMQLSDKVLIDVFKTWFAAPKQSWLDVVKEEVQEILEL